MDSAPVWWQKYMRHVDSSKWESGGVTNFDHLPGYLHIKCVSVPDQEPHLGEIVTEMEMPGESFDIIFETPEDATHFIMFWS